MKHILIFNSGYLPAKSYGGPVVSINNLVKALENKFRFTIITSSLEIDQITYLTNIKHNDINYLNNNEAVIYLDKKHYQFNYINKKLQQLPPFDLVYVNSFFSAKQLYLALEISKIYHTKILIAPRGELETNAFNIKKYKKSIYAYLTQIIFKRNNKVFFQATTTTEITNIQRRLNIPRNRIVLLENLPTESVIEQNKKKHLTKVENKLKIVFISRIQTKKNLHFALETLKYVNKNIEIIFDIYGPIENNFYWEKCQQIITELGNNVRVQYKGILDHDEVSEKFSEYELFYFPTLSENFGHVIYESLASYCPVLISDQTPWNDVNNTKAGKAFALDNKDQFIEYVNYLGEIGATKYKIITDSTKQYLDDKYNFENMKKEYMEQFNRLVD